MLEQFFGSRYCDGNAHCEPNFGVHRKPGGVDRNRNQRDWSTDHRHGREPLHARCERWNANRDTHYNYDLHGYRERPKRQCNGHGYSNGDAESCDHNPECKSGHGSRRWIVSTHSGCNQRDGSDDLRLGWEPLRAGSNRRNSDCFTHFDDYLYSYGERIGWQRYGYSDRDSDDGGFHDGNAERESNLNRCWRVVDADGERNQRDGGSDHRF
jgi:hypothetical protein